MLALLNLCSVVVFSYLEMRIKRTLAIYEQIKESDDGDLGLRKKKQKYTII